MEPDVINVLGRLGSAGALMVVVYFLFGLIKTFDGKLDAVVKDFREQLERRDERDAEVRKAFQDQMDRLFRELFNLTRETAGLFKTIESAFKEMKRPRGGDDDGDK